MAAAGATCRTAALRCAALRCPPSPLPFPRLSPLSVCLSPLRLHRQRCAAAHGERPDSPNATALFTKYCRCSLWTVDWTSGGVFTVVSVVSGCVGGYSDGCVSRTGRLLASWRRRRMDALRCAAMRCGARSLAARIPIHAARRSQVRSKQKRTKGKSPLCIVVQDQKG